jgi:hypothetical protein
VGSNLVLSIILDGNGAIAIPGLISVPNSGSFENKAYIVKQPSLFTYLMHEVTDFLKTFHTDAKF